MNKLDEIVAFKREELVLAKRERPLSQLEKRLKDRPPVRDFRSAIRRPGSLGLIAEIKHSSPSAGLIRPGADAVEVARIYQQAGAQAISVLTDEKFFQGSLKDLTAVRQKVNLPALRKDFLLEEYSVVEAAAAGADAVLLIGSVLRGPLLKRMLRLAGELGLEALVEVHAEPEVAEALEAGAQVLGINNRDLRSFEVDLKTTERLMKRVPPDRAAVSESGLQSRGDVQYVESKGVSAVLIGEELMRAPDIAQRVKELMGW